MNNLCPDFKLGILQAITHEHRAQILAIILNSGRLTKVQSFIVLVIGQDRFVCLQRIHMQCHIIAQFKVCRSNARQIKCSGLVQKEQEAAAEASLNWNFHFTKKKRKKWRQQQQQLQRRLHFVPLLTANTKTWLSVIYSYAYDVLVLNSMMHNWITMGKDWPQLLPIERFDCMKQKAKPIGPCKCSKGSSVMPSSVQSLHVHVVMKVQCGKSLGRTQNLVLCSPRVLMMAKSSSGENRMEFGPRFMNMDPILLQAGNVWA